MECPECGKSISDKAADCPHCGTSVRSLSVESQGTANGDEQTGSDDVGDDDVDGDPTRERAADRPSDGDDDQRDGDAGPASTGVDADEPAADPEPRQPSPDGPEDGRPSGDGAQQGPAPGTEPQQGGRSQGPRSQGQGPPDQPPQGQGSQEPPPRGQGGQGSPPQGPGQGPQDPSQDRGAQGPPPREQGSQGPPPQGQGQQGPPPQGQGQQGPPPQGQGQQGPAPGQSAGGRPAPAGGPGAPAAGQGGHVGGSQGRSLEDRLRALPLQTGALAGAGAGLLVFVLGAILAVAYPSDLTSGDLSTLDWTVMTLFDLQFVPPGNGLYHVTPLMNGHFDEFSATEGVFGLLYVVAALVLYRVGKLVARLHGTDDLSLQDSALTGASIVLGYLPIMLIAAIIGTSDPFEIELGTAVFLPGLVYPVLFGGIGGLLASYYYPGELRAGMGYAVAVSVVSFLLVFISTLVTVEEIPDGASEMTGRLITTFFAWVGALSLNLDADGVGLLPYAILIGLFLGAGVLRVERGPDLKSPVEAFASGASLATSFVVLAAILFSIAAVLYSVVLTGNDLQDAFLVVGQAVQDDALGGDYWKTFTEIGTYAENLLIATVVYPVVVSGCGGAALWWARNRDTREGYQQQGQPPQQPPQQPRR